MKRSIQLLLAMLIAIPAFTQTVQIVPPSDPQDAGQITVGLDLDSDGDFLGAVSLGIKYDRNLLDLVNYDGFSDNGVFTISQHGWGLELGWFDFSNPPVGEQFDGRFVTFTFQYEGSFDAALEFDLDYIEIANQLGNPIPNDNFEFINGSILANENHGNITIDDLLGGTPGDIVDLPVLISGFGPDDLHKAHSMQLEIEYDTDKLIYLQTVDNDIGFTVAENDGVISLSKTSLPDPIEFGADPVIKLRFEYLGGTAPVAFKPGSVVTNINAQNLNTVFVSGTVGQVSIKGVLEIEEVISDGAIPSIPGNPDSPVIPVQEQVKVSAADLADEVIGAITIKIAYDDSDGKLDFLGYQSPLSDWTLTQSPGQLSFSKTDQDGFTLDGDILTLSFNYYAVQGGTDTKADISFEPGTIVQDTALNFIAPELIDGWIFTVLLGDANCDGVVNVLDATTILNYIAGTLDPNVDFCFFNADVNQDGSIDVTDATGVLLLIANP